MATTTSKGSKSDVNPSQKLSLRQRLFSSGSRKSAGAAQTPSKQPKQSPSPQTDSAPPAAAESAPNHQEEPSTSTSSQQPDTTEAAATSSDKKATETDNLSPDMLIRTKHDDSDREQGSANTTLASKDRRVPFYRRKTGNKSSTSNTPLTSTSDPALTKAAMGNASASSRTSSSTRSKPSFLSRVVQKVVPCVSPDPDLIATPTIERPTPSIPDSRRMSTNKDPSTTGTIEMQQVDQEAVSSPPTPGAVNVSVAAASASSDAGASSPSTSPQPQSEPSDATPAPIDLDVLPLAITPTTAKDSQPPSPTDSEIIVTPPPNTHLLPEEETDGVTSGAVQPPGSTGHSTPGEAPHRHLHGHESSGDESDGTTYSDDELDDRQMRDEHEEEEWLIKNGGSGIPIGVDGLPKPLLPPILPEHAGRKCLVLDLDETLVHSSFKAVQQADFIVPVEIEYHWHHFHVLKRPGVDNFLKKMGEIYEVVVFTASLSKYADPVLDKLDIHKVVAHRLFRESCFSHKGNYVKDLSQLGRPIADTIILDNSPASYIFHPNNAVPVSSWFNDPHDAELTDLIPFLADLTAVPDVRSILDGAR